MSKTENNYDFRKRMLCVHEKNIRNTSIILGKNELALTGCVSIVISDEDEVILTAAQDFVDYLYISMGVSAAIVRKGTEISGQYVALELAENNGANLKNAAGYKGFRIDIDNNVIVSGFDARGIAQGLYHLEEIMTLKKAPYLTKGTIFRKPMFTPQMVHSGYGLDEYPDEHLQAIAHEGRDAILIFVKSVNITPYGYLDFNELIHRAKNMV